MRAIVGRSGMVVETQLPAINTLAHIQQRLTRADWLVTLRHDGKPDYIWGDEGKAREYLEAT